MLQPHRGCPRRHWRLIFRLGGNHPQQNPPLASSFERLPAELLDQIKAVFDVIGPYINIPLEQFEIGFMRDMHPQSEVALWFRITKAWLAYHEDFLANETLPDEDERMLLGDVIAISTGVQSVSKLDVSVEAGRRTDSML